MGTSLIDELKQKLKEYTDSFNIDNQNEKYIGVNAVDISKYIYDNPTFYEYLKYSFIGKHYDNLISLVLWLLILLFIGVGVFLYYLLGAGILFYILCFILLIVLIFILKLLNSGESYSQYYYRTFYNLILNVFNNISFKINTSRNLIDEEIVSIFTKDYSKKTTSKNIDFSGKICNGNVCDLHLINEISRTTKDGHEVKSSQTVFDGFYIKINLGKPYNKLKGNVIKIIDDENIISSLTEDTIKGVYESDLEFNFNSEEMNKSFDCIISGYTGFSDVDDMMLQVQKIITPSFEQHLLYLRERYNSFNMNISDSCMILSFNMKRSLFQKAKHKEVLEFSKSYREANDKLRLLQPSNFGIKEFAYYDVFPFMERLYLMNYLTYLYLSYIDFENYYDINNDSINSYEKQMKTIYTMENNEFKKLYTEKIKQIKKDTKNNLKEIKL